MRHRLYPYDPTGNCIGDESLGRLDYIADVANEISLFAGWLASIRLLERIKAHVGKARAIRIMETGWVKWLAKIEAQNQQRGVVRRRP